MKIDGSSIAHSITYIKPEYAYSLTLCKHKGHCTLIKKIQAKTVFKHHPLTSHSNKVACLKPNTEAF